MQSQKHVIDHRWGDRIAVQLPAALRSVQGHALDAMMGNVSRFGAYVRTRARPPVLSCVVVKVLPSVDEGLEAYVVRHGSDGIGLEWLEPNSRLLNTLLDRLPPLHGPAGRPTPASVELQT